jgi:hypothetical protein
MDKLNWKLATGMQIELHLRLLKPPLPPSARNKRGKAGANIAEDGTSGAARTTAPCAASDWR